MIRRRFFVNRDAIQDGAAVLPPDQAHHLRNVLRIEAGQVVEIFDGEGSGYSGEVALHGSAVVIRKLKKTPSEVPRIPLILASALIKPAKFEWVLQKATELGVDAIIPLITRRSEIRISEDKVDARLKRWERIVVEASKQCGRLSSLHVHKPLSLPDFLSQREFAAYTKLLFCERASEFWCPEPGSFSNGFVLCIGPEGGWASEEVEQAVKAGYQSIRLGPQTLRAETAALAAVSIIQYQISHFAAQR